jgi:hypothetical protein
MRLFIVSLSVVSFLGCSGQAKLNDAPVHVSGTVSQSGKPAGGVVMVFQPLGNGHMREFAVQRDGTFNGELVSGEYAYYVAQPAGAQTSTKIASKYFAAELSRTVTVQPGKQLAIALD